MVGASSAHLFPALLQVMLVAPLISRKGKQQLGFMGVAKINQADLDYLSGLLEDRKIVPVIERRYPFSQAADALGYLAEGHARAKVVITMEPAGSG